MVMVKKRRSNDNFAIDFIVNMKLCSRAGLKFSSLEASLGCFVCKMFELNLCRHFMAILFLFDFIRVVLS